MVSGDEDALNCDFAQYYRVYDWRELPLHTAAALAFGLPAESRSKMQLHGLKASPMMMMLAAATDYLALMLWRETKNGKAGRNPPSSFLKALTAEPAPAQNGNAAFVSAEDFERHRAELIKRGGK